MSSMLAELLAAPGVVETCELAGPIGFMALHGGCLERGTAEVARAAAKASGSSCYLVEQPEGFRWHVPSHLHAPESSPALRSFLDHVETVISIHGYGRDGFWTRILVGGANREFATRCAVGLRSEIDGFEIVDEVSDIPAALRGLHPKNPVNLARGGGIQLELPPRIRGLGPHGNLDHVAAIVAALVQVAR